MSRCGRGGFLVPGNYLDSDVDLQTSSRGSIAASGLAMDAPPSIPMYSADNSSDDERHYSKSFHICMIC